ncbi:MAG: 8-amino-7-oxononanoate synthase [Clostridia bacterium]|nr:8-amino-7-oxononanoate synthase [Clostridia bacterium]MDH7573922.1 8-amino-7-oxononanoate synthase [Clostridia bacterium]
MWWPELEPELAARRTQGLYRTLVPLLARQGPWVILEGKKVLNLCSNDYLGLAGHPRLAEACARAARDWGAGAAASRLVSGDLALHEQLEDKLARFKGTETALLYSSGYQANLGVIATLMREGDLILSDALNHASLIDACRLSRARVLIYRHRDLNHLEDLLRAHRSYRRKLIVTDGVFSMDGDLAPLPGLLELAAGYGAGLYVDDAHATGVLGAAGRGAAEHFGLDPRRLLIMGTLSKALGGFGAFLAGPEVVRSYLVNFSRPLLYTTAPPPPMVAVALEALEVLQEEPWRRQRLWELTAWFRTELRRAGFNTLDSETPIIPVVVGEAEPTLTLAGELLRQGIFLQAMRPPTVPPGSSRLRLSLTAAHTREDLERALDALVTAAKKLNLIPGG